MLLQFTVIQDGSLWVLDTDKLRFARVSRPVTEIVESPSADSAVEEFGKLVGANPLMEVYRLEGRDTKTEGPGCGLTSVAILVRIVDTVLEIGVNANVPIKDCACVKPIDRVECVVIGQGGQ